MLGSPKVEHDHFLDRDYLSFVAEGLRNRGWDVQAEHTGGGCYALWFEKDDGSIMLGNPSEEDLRRWWFGVNAQNGDYIGNFETELVVLAGRPELTEILDGIEPALFLLVPEKHGATEGYEADLGRRFRDRFNS